MTEQMRTSSAGLDLIRSFEGFRETSVRLPDGRWTVGYGHVRTAREGIRISESDALELLAHDLKPIEDGLRALLYAPVNQNQFDAMASLAFNISLGQFKESDVLQAINAGDEIAAAAGFDGWRKARVNGRMIIVDALVRRRAAEKALFLEPTGARPSAPTPIVTPVYDRGSPAAVVREIQGTEPYNPEVDDEADVDDAVPVEQAAPDIARAVADLAGRLDSIGKTSPSDRGQTSAPASIAAQRLSRILARVEGETTAGSLGAKTQQAAGHSAGRPVATAYEVPQDLPDFNGGPTQSNFSGKPVAIDDTEIVAPAGSVDDVFAAALEQERLVNQRQNGVSPGARRIWALAPWFAIAILCALGLGVAVVESAAQRPDDNLLGGAAPTMIAVFGLLLAMSGYYIVSRLSDED